MDFIMSGHIWLALMVTFLAGLATMIGGIIVIFFKQPSYQFLSFGFAFAAGAMIYVALTEILNKSVSTFSQVLDENYGFAFGTAFFLLGMIFILLLDRFIPHSHQSIGLHSSELDVQQQFMRTGLFTFFAITVHNLPEGLATFFAMLESPHVGVPLAIAIAIHNIPEGVAIALPVYMATQKRSLALLASCISGLAEPFGAVFGYFLLNPLMNDMIYGAIFGMIGGIMVYLALNELLPTAKKFSQGYETVYGLVAGMISLAASLVIFKFMR